MIKERVIWVTGAGRGIGRSIAMECAAAGAQVALMARTRSEVDAVGAEILDRYSVKTLAFTADVTNPEETQEIAAKIEAELGPVFGLVAAAGVYGAIGPIDETPPEEWRKSIEVNLIGAFNCIHAVAKGMKARKSGRIILFSGGGQGPLPNFSAYVSAKGAIWRLTETLGAELSPFGVFVNAIAPGAVNTRFLEDLLMAGESRVGKEFYRKSLKQKEDGGIPPEKVAKLAYYLLSERAVGLSGRTLSAVWDNYEDLGDLEALSKTDLFTMKRVVDSKGGTRASS